jgi:hypothetical protein
VFDGSEYFIQVDEGIYLVKKRKRRILNTLSLLSRGWRGKKEEERRQVESGVL